MRYLFTILMMLMTLPVISHEIRPAYLEINQEENTIYSIVWKTPMRGDSRLALAPAFSGLSEHITPTITRRAGNAAIESWRIKVTEPLRGQTLHIDGLEGTMTDVLVRASFTDETTWTHRFTPTQQAIQIPVQESGLTVANVYLKLGIEHILSGIDHLLFVFALLFITGAGWQLVKTITAFTVAHSITLALATLGLVHLPSSPIEAVIALSIVFLAAEIARAYKGVVGMTYRSPWLIAFIFGLLHGFGFAGALSEIGLPQGQIPLALLFFNVGVELGQLLFITVVLGLMMVLKRIYVPRILTAVFITSYAIGTLAMFWLIQRVASF